MTSDNENDKESLIDMASLIELDEEPFITDCDGGVDRRIGGSCSNRVMTI
jgi:hypothetical protein